MKSISAKPKWSREMWSPSHCSVVDGSTLELARMAFSSEICTVACCQRMHLYLGVKWRLSRGRHTTLETGEGYCRLTQSIASISSGSQAESILLSGCEGGFIQPSLENGICDSGVI